MMLLVSYLSHFSYYSSAGMHIAWQTFLIRFNSTKYLMIVKRQQKTQNLFKK